jgi:DnaK suppressor protein
VFRFTQARRLLNHESGSRTLEERNMTERYNQHREKLLAARREVAQKTAGLDEIAVERNADPLDELQRATERELAITRLDLDRATLRAIDAALQRMDAGDYGICAECEESISSKRLSAIPWASLCIACQEQADSEKATTEERRFGQLSDAA